MDKKEQCMGLEQFVKLVKKQEKNVEKKCRRKTGIDIDIR